MSEIKTKLIDTKGDIQELFTKRYSNLGKNKTFREEFKPK